MIALGKFFSIAIALLQMALLPAYGGGSVSGRITLAGSFTKPKALPVFKSRSFCGATVVNETLLVSRDGGLKNAVVILRPSERHAVVAPGESILDNSHCAFTPHVQVATVGSALLLKNSDPILHTVHARLGSETLFNVGLPKWRQVSKRLDRVGVIKIDCDVLHTWMNAAIVVTDSPYFAVSDEKGFFVIEGLPAGVYEMEIWQERLGARRLNIRVGDEIGLTVDVVYSAEIIK
ncbi:MAG: hypothetical protein EXR70_17765 [Deltaproteobacteria bacterium]|nr:hypothetical protein [Deltaproteobacteria bacterium]